MTDIVYRQEVIDYLRRRIEADGPSPDAKRFISIPSGHKMSSADMLREIENRTHRGLRLYGSAEKLYILAMLADITKPVDALLEKYNFRAVETVNDDTHHGVSFRGPGGPRTDYTLTIQEDAVSAKGQEAFGIELEILLYRGAEPTVLSKRSRSDESVPVRDLIQTFLQEEVEPALIRYLRL